MSTNVYATLSELTDSVTSVTGSILDLCGITSNEALVERSKLPEPEGYVDKVLPAVKDEVNSAAQADLCQQSMDTARSSVVQDRLGKPEDEEMFGATM